MHVKDCPKCGGTHWTQYECPFTDAQIEKMGIANVRPNVGSNRSADRIVAGDPDRLPAIDDLKVLKD